MGHVHGLSTAVYTTRVQVYTCTRPLHRHVHSVYGPCTRPCAVYTAVYTARTQLCNCCVHVPCPPCTWRCNGRVHVYTCTRAVYTAVDGPCTRPVYTAAYTARTFTQTIHGHVHGRYNTAVITAVYTAVYTVVSARVHGRVRAVSARVHGRVRAVYMTGRVRCRVHVPYLRTCTRPCTARVYRPCTWPCTGRVHGHGPCTRLVRSVLLRFSLQKTPFMPRRTAINPLHSKRARTTSAPSAALRRTTV